MCIRDRIWPWLVETGCGRGGFYALDGLDNGGARSAREIHPEWQELRVGDVLPATPNDGEGFEVLRIEPSHALVLGATMGNGERRWKSTWAFVLEPLDEA